MRHFTPIIIAALMATSVVGAGLYEGSRAPIELRLALVR